MHKPILSTLLLTLLSVMTQAKEPHALVGKSALLARHKQIKAVDIPLQTSFTLDSDWGTGYTAYVNLKNNSNEAITSWRATMTLAAGQTIDSVWSGKLVSNQGGILSIVNESWNNAIAPGQSVSFGYQVTNPQRSSHTPASISAVGNSVATQPGASFPLAASFAFDNQWPTGYQVTITLKNNNAMPTSTWEASFVLPTDHKVSNYWNGVVSTTGTTVTVKPPLWAGGGVIPANGSTTIGLIISKPLNSSGGISQLQAVANGHATPGPQLPAAPVLNPIAINPSSPRNYNVSWNSVSGADSYKLEEATTSSFSNAKTISQGATLSYAFSNKADGTYFYRVSASNASGTSAFSNIQQVSISTTPITLTAPVVQAINNPSGARQFNVSWNAVTNAQGYTLQQSTTSNGSFTTIYSGNSTSAQLTVAAAGTYYYRVIATAGSISSAPSNVVSTNVTQTPTPSKFIIDGYWESWNSRDPLNDIVNMHVDVINISFANFRTTGTHTFEIAGVESDLATVRQLVTLAHGLNKKVKIAVGGISYPMSPQLKTTEDARGMAQAVAKYVNDNNLDGVDYDIEDFPAAELQVALLKYSREFLPTKLITYTPMSPASSTYPFNQVIQNGHQYMDYLSIMAYNYGPGYRYQDDVQALRSMGVPAAKIVVGLMPGYDDVGVRTTVADISTAANFIKQSNIKGIMFWSLNRDYANETGLGKNAATNTAWNVFNS